MKIRYQCPCCGYYTFDEPTGKTFDICPICFWEDDGEESGGANQISLHEAKVNFKLYAACTPNMISRVRYATPEDRICADICDLLKVCANVDNNGVLKILKENYNSELIAERFIKVSDDDNIVAVIDVVSGIAYVQKDHFAKIKSELKEQAFKYICMESLYENNLICQDYNDLPDDFKYLKFSGPFSIMDFIRIQETHDL